MSTTKGVFHKRCVLTGRLDEKVAIVTGASSGIGMHTAGELARRGAVVIMACRNLSKGQVAKNTLLSLYGQGNPNWEKTDISDPAVLPSLKPIQPEQLILEELNLASMYSINQFAKKIAQGYPKVNFLINNAGVSTETFTRTTDGFEEDMGVNHLGHFLLTERLLPLLKEAPASRIIIVSAASHLRGQLYKPDLQIPENQFTMVDAYNASKLANVMHAVELAKRLEDTDITVVCVNPGNVLSELSRHAQSFFNWWKAEMLKPFCVSPWDGAQTTLFAVLADNLVSGGYYSNCTLQSPSRLVNNEEDRKWFWKKSCELVGLSAE